MKPYYDYDVSYIIDMIEGAGLPYKVIGMSDLGDENRAWAWTVRFDNVNYIEVYAEHYVIQLGTYRMTYNTTEEFVKELGTIMKFAKEDGVVPTVEVIEE